MALYEISKQRQLDCLRTYYYRGRRTFITTDPEGDAGDQIGADYPGTFPAPSGNDSTPICTRTRVVWNPGNPPTNQRLLIADYETSGVGFYRIYVRSMADRIKRYYTVGNEGEDAALIEGRESDGWHEWQCVTGNNFAYESALQIRIDTSYTAASMPYSAINQILDCVNDGAFSFGSNTAADQTLWFRHLVSGSKRIYNVIDTSFFFDWIRAGSYTTDPLTGNTGWNGRVLTRRGVWITEEVNTFAGSSATDDIRRVVTFHPGKQLSGSGAAAILEDSLDATSAAVVATASFAGLGLASMTQW